MQAAYKFVCEQSSRLMKTNRNRAFPQAKTTDEKRDAVKVMLTFSAPLPEKMTLVPSQRDCARVLGMPQSTLATREKALIEKRRQLSAGKKGIFWALAKRKKGHSKINDAIRLLLVTAFNNHPHIIVSPNARDTLQVKHADGKTVAVPKLLTQVGLGTIFSHIIKDNPTIKNKVGECAFRYIISGLGSVRCFTNSYKQMCGCTEACTPFIVRCLQNAVSCTASLQLTRNIARVWRRPRRRQANGLLLHGTLSYCWLSRRAPASNGVCMLCHTGSVRRSSAATARSTLFQRRRHETTEPRRTYPFTSTSTRSVCARTARSVGGWS